MTVARPKYDAALVDANGRPTTQWYAFLSELSKTATAADIAAIATALGSPDGTIANIPEPGSTEFTITGLRSIQVVGSLESGNFSFQLRGDTDYAGNTYYYGTDADGDKGFHPVADALSATAAGVALTVGADGVTDITPDDDLEAVEALAGTGLATRTADDTWATRALTLGTGLAGSNLDGVAGDPLLNHAALSPFAFFESDNSGTVVLQDIRVDIEPYGHISGISAGTVDVATALAGTFEPAITSGTTAQFWRGDKVFSDTLTNTLFIDADNVVGGITATRYADDTAPAQFRSQKARGSLATPAAVQSGDQLVTLQGRGYHSGANFGGNVADFRFIAAEDFTSTAQGTTWSLGLTAVGSTTRATRLEVDSTFALNPGANNTQDLGTTALEWRAGYFGTNLFIGANQVIGARDTGWGAQTGTATKTSYATYTAAAISNPPTQAQVQAIANALQAADRRLKALTDALIAHGLIGT